MDRWRDAWVDACLFLGFYPFRIVEVIIECAGGVIMQLKSTSHTFP